MSTKAGTLVEIFPAGQLAGLERLSSAKTTHRGCARLIVAAFALDQVEELLA